MAETTTIPLATYLFKRLLQLGVSSMHGVPGDYNLQMLDYVEPSGMHWVGNCNELNAGYAADGYARVKGLGSLITTFGVGELSAINAIAGAYAELAPVVHIVGTPARQQQESRAPIHHTFNDGEYGRFAQMHAHVTIAQTALWDIRTAQDQIDTLLQQCISHSRPVYLQFPVDMVGLPVPATRLETTIPKLTSISLPDQQSALKLILDRIYKAKQPMIIVDGETRPYGIVDLVKTIVEKTGWPTFTSAWGKSIVDESLPNVFGINAGKFASAEDSTYIKGCDLVLVFGPHFSTTNSYFLTSVPDPSVSILIKQTSIVAGSNIYRDVPARDIVQALVDNLDFGKIVKSSRSPNTHKPVSKPSSADTTITQQSFYHFFNQYLRQGDIVMGETGTAAYGVRDFLLPKDTQLFTAVTWLSIGYMLPAAQGAGIAARELFEEGKTKNPPRTVLLIGDGSYQMTAQELSTIIREKLNMVIVLINNDGYTIERCIHGMKEGYNDVARWKYLETPSAFGADQDYAPTHTVRSWSELTEAMKVQETAKSPVLQMLEVFMDVEDAPRPLLAVLEAAAAARKAAEATR